MVKNIGERAYTYIDTSCLYCTSLRVGFDRVGLFFFTPGWAFTVWVLFMDGNVLACTVRTRRLSTYYILTRIDGNLPNIVRLHYWDLT